MFDRTVITSLHCLSRLLSSVKLGFVFVVMFLVTSLNLATPSHAQTQVDSTFPVSEGSIEERTARIIINYNDTPASQGETVEIQVTVIFLTGQAEADDFDADPDTPGIQPLTAPRLANLIEEEEGEEGEVVPINNTALAVLGVRFSRSLNIGESISDGLSATVERTIGTDGMTTFIFELEVANDDTAEAEEQILIIIEKTIPSRSDDDRETMIARVIIAANDMTWSISTTTPTVNEDDNARYTVRYRGPGGDTLSIRVTVNPSDLAISNPAMANDFFNPPNFLTSAALASAIDNVTVTPGGSVTAMPSTDISAMVTLTTAATGNTDFSFSFELPIFNDPAPEGAETFTVTLSYPSETPGTPNNTDTVTTTIAANDTTPQGTWAIRPPTQTVEEGEQASYTVQYTGNPEEQGATVEIQVTVNLGTAEANDFDPLLVDSSDVLESAIRNGTVTEGTRTNVTGNTGRSATVELTIGTNGNASFSFDLTIANDIDPAENAETFTVTLSGQTPRETTMITTATATTTIATNNIEGIWTISTTTPRVNEGDDARSSYTVQYTGSTANPGQLLFVLVTVEFSENPEDNPAEDDDFDFDPSPERIQPLTSDLLVTTIGTASVTLSNVINANVARSVDARGKASFSFDLPIANDTEPEEDQTFTVRISAPTLLGTGRAIIDNNADRVTTTIAANDMTPQGTWTISESPAGPVNEGDDASYTVAYTSNDPTEQGSTVSILVTVGFTTGQADANDFNPPLTSATLSDAISGGTPTPRTPISARVELTTSLDSDGNVTASFSVVLPIADDTDPEDNETFTVTFSGQTPGTEFPTNTATTTIAVNDLTWAISPETLTVAEGDDARYTVQYSGLLGDTPSIIVTVSLSAPEIASDFTTSLDSAVLASAIDNVPVTPGGSVTATTNSEPGISATVTLTTTATGNTDFSFNLPIRMDGTLEGDEIFTVEVFENQVEGNSDA